MRRLNGNEHGKVMNTGKTVDTVEFWCGRTINMVSNVEIAQTWPNNYLGWFFDLHDFAERLIHMESS